MKKRVGVVSLGCPKNLVDSEIMLGLLKKEEYEIVNQQEEADIIIVNTCGFIETAKQESINTILEMAQCKQNQCKCLIVTGCMAQRYKKEILDQIPEVDAVIGTGSYAEIARVIGQAFEGERQEHYGELNDTGYLENERILSTGKGYAYLKIAEGCDNCCTYCIIPSLRGKYRSRRMEDLVKEASRLAEQGVRELILIAQDTTRYGMDLYKEKKLPELIGQISRLNGIDRIRVLYCYPEEIDDRLIQVMETNPKVCRYLDIPIQHASDRILKLMGRRGRKEELEALLDKLRERIPGIILRTSLIVGFPGEDEQDFSELLEFVKKYRFDRLGVFMYSKEEDTPAAKMKGQIPKKMKKQRYDAVMKIQQQISEKSNEERLGKVYKVLVEGVSEDGIFYYGRSCAEAPDIDGKIYMTSPNPLEVGEFVEVKILNTDQYDLVGEVENESAQ